MTPRLLVALLAVACLAAAHAQMPTWPVVVDDSSFGLAKGSVFDTATPKSYSFEGPGAGRLIAPPPATPTMIPHAIETYLPIAVDRNECMSCHVRPAGTGAKAAKGAPRATPASHFVQKDGKLVLSGAQYTCTACHAPQAGVAPLVGNSASPLR